MTERLQSAMSDLPTALQARLRAIRAPSPADWQLSKVTSGQDSGICPADPVDGSGQDMRTLIVGQEPA